MLGKFFYNNYDYRCYFFASVCKIIRIFLPCKIFEKEFCIWKRVPTHMTQLEILKP